MNKLWFFIYLIKAETLSDPGLAHLIGRSHPALWNTGGFQDTANSVQMTSTLSTAKILIIHSWESLAQVENDLLLRLGVI